MNSSGPFDVCGYNRGAIPTFRRMLGQVLGVAGDRFVFTETAPFGSSVVLDGRPVILTKRQLETLSTLVKDALSELQAFDGSKPTMAPPSRWS